jgi:hypothetical protein
MKAKVTGRSAWQGVPDDGYLNIHIIGDRWADAHGNATVSRYSGRLNPGKTGFGDAKNPAADLYIPVQGPGDPDGPLARFEEILVYGGETVRSEYTRRLIATDLDGLIFDYAAPEPTSLPPSFGQAPLTIQAAQQLLDTGTATIAQVDQKLIQVDDSLTDIAQQQDANDARQDANDAEVSTALSRLAPLSGASYPNGVTVGGREVAWGFQDETGRFWFQFDPAGKMYVWGGIDLSNVTGLNAATVTSVARPQYIGEYEGVPLVQDPNGRVGQALLTDGRMLFPNGIVAPGLSISGVTTDPDGGVRVNGRRAVSSRDQYRVGDSLSDLNNSTVLTTGTGRQLSKNAVGGQTSTEIAARIGAWPVYAKPTGNSVPASGAVGVAIVAAPTAPHVGAIDLLRHTGDRSTPGWLGGVYGTLSRTGGVPNNAVDLTRYTFTRQSAGAAVATDAALGVQFVPDLGDMLNRTVILWAGNNNYFEPEIIKRDVRACVATFQALRTRFVLLTLMNGDFQGRRKNDVPNTDYQRIIDYNTWLMNEFPRYALDIRTLMPRTADTDVVDPAYRVDGIHLTNPGYDLVDTHTLRFELERGW